MTVEHFRNNANFWRSPLLPGADMMTAEFYDHEFTLHWHDAYTIPVIEAGAQSYKYGGTRHVADAGSMPVINPGELHTGARATDVGWRYRVFYLPVHFVQSVANQLTGQKQAMPWFPAGTVRDIDVARRIQRAHRALEARVDPLAAEHLLFDAVATLLVRHAGQRLPLGRIHADSARVSLMKARLADDLSAPVSLTELAETVGLSTFHAARLFSRETGVAPHAWRNQMRLNRALEGLRGGSSVTAVAAASGFTDQSHFTRHFKKAFGVTPGRWR